MEIRIATSADLAEVREIVERAYSPYVERIGRRPAPMDSDYSALIARGSVTVLGDRDRVIGLIVLEEADDYLLVENIAVDPCHQSQGHGRALLEFAEGRARKLGISELRLYTNAAMRENIETYQHLGWTEDSRRVSEAGFARVYFRKPTSA